MNHYLKPFFLRYRGYLNPKRVLPKESILYHVGSVFSSLLLYMVLSFFDVDSLLACCSGTLVSVFLYLLLFRANNKLFAMDKDALEHLIVNHKVNAVKLLSPFFKDVQSAFDECKIRYCEVNEDIQKVDVSILFTLIFHEDAGQLVQLFHKVGGRFFSFLESLSPAQREVLYRYYLVDSIEK